jgi:hypothetical protein
VLAIQHGTMPGTIIRTLKEGSERDSRVHETLLAVRRPEQYVNNRFLSIGRPRTLHKTNVLNASKIEQGWRTAPRLQ